MLKTIHGLKRVFAFNNLYKIFFYVIELIPPVQYFLVSKIFSVFGELAKTTYQPKIIEVCKCHF